MGLRKLLWIFVVLAAVPLVAQQPQTGVDPPYAVNARYVNGVAPGYWPQVRSRLVLSVGAGTVNCNSAMTPYAGGTLTMANNTTNYVYLDTAASCVPGSNTTGFVSTLIPIATVLTSSGVIVSVTDDRTPFTTGTSSSGGGVNILPLNNKFTGTNSFGQNVAFKGPNPYYDLTAIGLYTGSGGAIACSTTAGSTTVNCPGGIGDFAVGQGIEIPLAGIASTFNAWGVSPIIGFSRDNNIARYSMNANGVAVPGANQTVTITGLSNGAFNGTFTVTGNDGDFGHFSAANPGSGVGTTSSAGTATLTSAPVVVTPQGVLGSTTYNYKIVLRGYQGQLSVASTAGTTTTGAAALGVNTVNVTSCARSGGLATCTTAAAHGFQAGVPVDLEGTTQFGSIANQYNGAHIIASTPSRRVFTFWQIDQGNDSSTDTGGTAKVVAKNMVQWDMVPYTVLQSIVYRSIGAGAYSIVGIVEGMDGAFVDWGLGAPVAPRYIPTTPPRSATNGILATTITNISGTTLTVANAATATATNQAAQHDNTPIVLNACAALPTNGGGTLYIPATNPLASAQFNSPLDLLHNCHTGQVTIKSATDMALNDPVIMMKAGTTFNSAPGSQRPGINSFVYGAYTSIFGNAYPFFYFQPGSFGPNTLAGLSMNCNGAYQSCVVQDQDQGGGGNAAISYDNDIFSGIFGSMPFIMRSGGFNFWFTKTLFKVDGGAWGVPEALQITVPNPLGGTDALLGNGWTCASQIEFSKTTFAGHGIEYNDWGTPHLGGIGCGHITFFETGYESAYMPWMSVYLTGTNSAFNQVTIINGGYSDYRSGVATPFIAFSPGARVGNLTTFSLYCGNGFQPLFEGTITAGVEVYQGSGAACSLMGTNNVTVHNLVGSAGGVGATNISYIGTNVRFSGNGKAFYVMAPPAAPTSAVVSAGGSDPLGNNCYAIYAFDKDGGWTNDGPRTCATVTSGNQTVTVTRPTLPGNAVAWNVSWSIGGGTAFLACSPIPIATTFFVHSNGSSCGNPYNTNATAGKSTLGPTGISSDQITGNQLNMIQTAFANLGTPANGALVYCFDCQVVNPCAGSGTGAFAKRLNGQWACN